MKHLTVGLIAGPHRDRARRALESLLQQSISGRMKVHVVDTQPDAEPLVSARLPSGLELEVTASTSEQLLGSARALVARKAETPLVGFLEEHCVAEPGWAAAMVEAHEDARVAAVAGVITNLESEPLLPKVAALCCYRASLPPVVESNAKILFGQNACYKTDDLRELDSRLDDFLTTELLLFRRFLAEGRTLRVVAGACLQHAGLSRYRDALHGVYNYERAVHGIARRWGHSSTPIDLARAVLSPLARTIKTAAAESRIRGFPVTTLFCLPFAVLIHTAAATGQLAGRLLGPGESPTNYSRNELVTARTALPSPRVR